MAGQSSAMVGKSWTDVSVLGSQVFGQALMDSCDMVLSSNDYPHILILLTKNNCITQAQCNNIEVIANTTCEEWSRGRY